jgi:hypothetical protein
MDELDLGRFGDANWRIGFLSSAMNLEVRIYVRCDKLPVEYSCNAGVHDLQIN